MIYTICFVDGSEEFVIHSEDSPESFVLAKKWWKGDIREIDNADRPTGNVRRLLINLDNVQYIECRQSPKGDHEDARS